MGESKRISTLSSPRSSISFATTSRGRMSSGIASRLRPSCSPDSNRVIPYPFRDRSQAAVRLSRSLPTIAIRFSFLGRARIRCFGAGVVTQARSNRPISMACPALVRLQWSRHGASQIRPRMPGKGMVFLSTFQASWKAPRAICPTKTRASR